MANDLSIVREGEQFSSASGFELAQRVAGALCSSTMIPREYRGKENLGNVLVALDISQRLQMSPLMVMQNLHMIHGKPAWSGQFAIAAVNNSGRFSEPLRFAFGGEPGTDTWDCRAIGKTHSGQEIEGPRISIGMAKAEGWIGKSGSKWKTMPDLMLRYRAGAWFARTQCPEILMGIQTVEEIQDVARAKESSVVSEVEAIIDG
jgi:hypothetical protein